MATPAKLTPAVHKSIVSDIERGQYIVAACAKAGIHRDTFYAWIERGQLARADREAGKRIAKTEQPYLDFLEATELARDAGEAWLVDQLLDAAADPKGRGQWTAYMTLLERTRPDRFRRPQQVQPTGGSPATLTFDPKKLSADELDQLEQLLVKARPGDTDA